MKRGFLRSSMIIIGFLGIPSLSGCRDPEPGPVLPLITDSEGDLLPPTGAMWYGTPYRKNDTADWVPFRKLSEMTEAGEDEPDEKEESVEGEGGGIEAEVREFLKEYEEVAAEIDLASPDFDELLDYHVDSQREALRSILTFGAKMAQKFDRLRAAIEVKLPDQKERIETVFNGLGGNYKASLAVGDLKVISDEEVKISAPGNTSIPICSVRLVDDEWMIEMAQLPDAAMLATGAGQVDAMFDGWISGVESGKLPAETLLQQIETQATMLRAMMGGGANTQPPAESQKAADEAPDEDAKEEPDKEPAGMDGGD